MTNRAIFPSSRVRGVILVLGILGWFVGCGDRADTPLDPTRPAPTPGAAIVDPEIDRPLPGSSRNIPSRTIGGAGGPYSGEPGYVWGQVIVRLALGEDLDTFNEVWETTTIEQIGAHAVLAAPAGSNVRLLARAMQADEACDVADLNWLAEAPESDQGTIPSPESPQGLGSFEDVQDQEALTRIGIEEAHTVATGQGVVVAVLDTGVDSDHPDLAGAILPGGWDFIDDDPLPLDERSNLDHDDDGLLDEGAGHGTHVAGIVLAVAPDAGILPVRVLDSDGIGTSVAVARGIRWAMAAGVDVINLSLGMNADADVIKEAVQDADDAGIIVVTAAGNRGREDKTHFPSRLSKVASVAATDAIDDPAYFTSFASSVDVSAPGVGILSTWLDDGYAIWSGTSMSTPMVSGAAALRLEVMPFADLDSFLNDLEDSVVPLPYPEELPYAGKMGSGRLDVAALLTLWP
jgi:subtilisin family serine protease